VLLRKLENLKGKIMEIKNFGQPPQPIQRLIQALFLLLSVPESFTEVRMISDWNFEI